MGYDTPADHHGPLPVAEKAEPAPSISEKVKALPQQWRNQAAFDGYMTGIPHIDEATSNRASAKCECAEVLEALLEGREPSTLLDRIRNGPPIIPPNHPTVPVDGVALRALLVALHGLPHHIRELQVLTDIQPDNPINVITAQFNAFVANQPKG